MVSLMLVSGTSSAITITVDAKSNIFGAGHTAPPAPGGLGPGILPPSYSFLPASGQVMTFSSIIGSKTYNNHDYWGPEGYDPWLFGMNFPSYGGISGIVTSSHQFLAGVFLNGTEPTDPAPSSLDFGPDGLTRNFTDVNPDIGQLFFIGDGLTDSGLTQNFYVPLTASRLFLGFIDVDWNYLPGFYHDNFGSLTATFDIQPVPEPTTILLLGSGLIGLAGFRKKFRKR